MELARFTPVRVGSRSASLHVKDRCLSADQLRPFISMAGEEGCTDTSFSHLHPCIYFLMFETLLRFGLAAIEQALRVSCLAASEPVWPSATVGSFLLTCLAVQHPKGPELHEECTLAGGQGRNSTGLHVPHLS